MRYCKPNPVGLPRPGTPGQTFLLADPARHPRPPPRHPRHARYIIYRIYYIPGQTFLLATFKISVMCGYSV